MVVVFSVIECSLWIMLYQCSCEETISCMLHLPTMVSLHPRVVNIIFVAGRKKICCFLEVTVLTGTTVAAVTN